MKKNKNSRSSQKMSSLFGKSKSSKLFLGTLALTPLLVGIGSTASYSMWNSSTQVTVPQAVINLNIPVDTLTWSGNQTAKLYDGKATDLNFANLTGKYSNLDADNVGTTTGWTYRAVAVKPVADKTGTLNVTTKSGTPVLSGMTPSPATTTVPTQENIRLVNSEAECSNDVSVAKGLNYSTNASWSGNATPGLICITQRRELLVTRTGTVNFTGEGTADQPAGAPAPTPTKPTDSISTSMPVLKDMGANQIVSTFKYTITAGSQAGKCGL